MRKIRWFAGLFTSLLFACGGGGDGGGGGAGGVGRVGGFAVKNTLRNATVEVWKVGDIGVGYRLIGSGNTDNQGRFEVSTSGTGWAYVKVWGGTFTDEATGLPATIPQDKPMKGVANVTAGSGLDIVVTPVTTFVACRAEALARDAGTTFDAALDNAVRMVEQATGVPNVLNLRPADLTAGPVAAGDAANYGAVLAGLSEYAFTLGVGAADLSYAAARDGSDGHFDGTECGDGIDVDSVGPLAPGFLTQLGSFTGLWVDFNPNNASGLDSGDVGGATDALSAAGDRFEPRPRVASVWGGYTGLQGGAAVTLRGQDFPPNPEVRVGTATASVVSESPDEIEFLTPSLSLSGSYAVRVTNPLSGLWYEARSTVRAYDENAPPTLTGIDLAEGPLCGGARVTLTGTNLGPGTQVTFDGLPAMVENGKFPGSITVIAPRVASPGPVDVRVQTAAGTATLPAAFTYKDKDVGPGVDQSDFTTDRVSIFGRVELEPEFSYTVGTLQQTFDGAGQGTFLEEAHVVRGSGVTIETSSGSQFYTAHRGKVQWLTVDTQNNTRFYAGAHEEANGLITGLTAGGMFHSFPVASGLGNGTLTGVHHASGFLLDLSTGEITGLAGSVEFDGQGAGAVNLKVEFRDSAAGEFGTAPFATRLTYDVQGDGAAGIVLDPDSAAPWSFSGRVAADGSLAEFYYTGSELWQSRVAVLYCSQAGEGVDPEEFSGNVLGGFLSESPGAEGSEFGTFLLNILTDTSEGESNQLTFKDGVKFSAGDPQGADLQRTSLTGVTLGHTGVLEYGDFSVGGYYDTGRGYLTSVGRLADNGSAAFLDDPFVVGLAVRIPQYYTKSSLDGTFNVLNISSQWLDPQDPPTGDEVNQTRIGTTRFDPRVSVTIGGEYFRQAGGVADQSIFLKSVLRSGLDASVTGGADIDFQASFGYTFAANQLHFMVTEVDPGSPLEEQGAGFLAGTGKLSPSGGFGGFVSSPAKEGTSFTAFAPVTEGTPSLDGTSWGCGGIGFDFNGSGATVGEVDLGTVGITGGSVSYNFTRYTEIEGGSTSVTGGTTTGSVFPKPGGQVDFVVDGRTYGGFVADGVIVTADLSESVRSGLNVYVERSSGSPPPKYDYGWSSFGKMFNDSNLPAFTTLGLGSGSYTPDRNLIGFEGLDQGRSNTHAGTAQQRQFNSGTSSVDGTGLYRFSVGQTNLLGYLGPDGCYGFGVPVDTSDEPTELSFKFHFNF